MGKPKRSPASHDDHPLHRVWLQAMTEPWELFADLVLDRDTNAARNVEKKGRDTAFGEGAAAGPSQNREAPSLFVEQAEE